MAQVLHSVMDGVAPADGAGADAFTDDESLLGVPIDCRRLWRRLQGVRVQLASGYIAGATPHGRQRRTSP